MATLSAMSATSLSVSEWFQDYPGDADDKKLTMDRQETDEINHGQTVLNRRSCLHSGSVAVFN